MVLVIGCVQQPEVTTTTVKETTTVEEVPEGTYVNSKYGISIVPPEGWVTDESQPLKRVVAFLGPTEDDFAVNMVILIRKLPYEISLEEFIKEGKKDLVNFQDFNMVSERDRIIDGIEAHEWVFTFKMDTFNLKEKQVFLIKNGKVYLITCAALQSNYDTYEPIFEESIQTLKID